MTSSNSPLSKQITAVSDNEESDQDKPNANYNEGRYNYSEDEANSLPIVNLMIAKYKAKLSHMCNGVLEDGTPIFSNRTPRMLAKYILAKRMLARFKQRRLILESQQRKTSLTSLATHKVLQSRAASPTAVRTKNDDDSSASNPFLIDCPKESEASRNSKRELYKKWMELGKPKRS